MKQTIKHLLILLTTFYLASCSNSDNQNSDKDTLATKNEVKSDSTILPEIKATENDTSVSSQEINNENQELVKNEKKQEKPRPILVKIVEDEEEDENEVDVNRFQNEFPTSKPTIDQEETIFASGPENNVQFKGGEQALQDFIVDNLVYPGEEKLNEIEGFAIVAFVINVDGTVADVKINRSSGNKALDQEAIRIVKMTSGKWTPATIKNKPVRTISRLPISFEIDSE